MTFITNIHNLAEKKQEQCMQLITLYTKHSLVFGDGPEAQVFKTITFVSISQQEELLCPCPELAEPCENDEKCRTELGQ